MTQKRLSTSEIDFSDEEDANTPEKPLVLADGKTIANMNEEERRAFAIALLKRISKQQP